MILAGQRRSGKTVLAINILCYLTEKYHYANVFLFSDTAQIEANGSFKFMKKECMFSNKDISADIPVIMKY